MGVGPYDAEVVYMHRYDSDFDYQGDFIDRWNKRMGRARVGMCVLGALLIVAGIFSVIAPYSLYSFIQIVAGTALFVHGASQVVSYFGTPEFFRNPVLMASGVLSALLGIMVLALPTFLTASTLVILLAFMLILMGFGRISFAGQMRYFQLAGSSASTVSGVINIIMGVLFICMPVFSSVVLSYVLAAYLIIAGVTLAVEGISLKHIER